MPPSTKQALKEARAAIDRKDFDEAISLSRQALQNDPNSYNAYVFIGIATAAKQDFDHAHQAYNRAISIKPDNPLAYKGLIEALSKPTATPQPLALAAAHISLAAHSAQFAAQSLSSAADALFIAERQLDNLSSTVTDLLGVLDARAISINPTQTHSILIRLVRLLSGTLPESDHVARMSALDVAPLSDLIVRFTHLALDKGKTQGLQQLPQDVLALVVARAQHHCMNGHDVESNLDTLRAMNAYDALLTLAEVDELSAYFPPGYRIKLAARSIHMQPHLQRCSDAKSVLAGILLSSTPPNEAPPLRAVMLSGVLKDRASKVPPSSKEVADSPTQALIRAVIHFRSADFRWAVQSSAAGRRCIAQSPSPKIRSRLHRTLDLVHAAALRETRKFKESTRVFEIVRKWARDESDSWLDGAAARGLIATAVSGHGRRSRQASTAVEEAAAVLASNNTFGLIECVWADALLGDDLDIERMTELAVVARARARDEPSNAAGTWEYEVLDPTFAWSHAELAALAAGRLAQMKLKASGLSDVATLAEAQELHMEAAALVRTAPDPLAHLGYVFECLAVSGEESTHAKMRTRATRCYEKALGLDPAHPLAARQLARLHLNNGRLKEAARVAARAAEKNSKPRWTHNFLGWHCFRRKDFAAAAVAFQTPLKGTPKLSAREEEILFGTGVGQQEDDNDLVMDIDSWRGLAFSYARQAMTGPACSCLERALSLLQKPPACYRSIVHLNLKDITRSLETLLQTEKSMILVLGRMGRVAEEFIRPIMGDPKLPLTVLFYNSEMLMQLAATQWLNGCYRRSLATRKEAAGILESCIEHLVDSCPDLPTDVLYKRIGDMWLESVTECPEHLMKLAEPGFIEDSLSKAEKAYNQAESNASKRKSYHYQDLVAVKVRKALCTKDDELAREMTKFLLESGSDPVLQCLGLLALGKLSSSLEIMASIKLADQLVKSCSLKKSQEILLNAAAAMLAPKASNLKMCSEAAISALRNDPTNWRCWLAVATVRETDAERSDWPRRMVRSCDDALNSADRLGGGPVVVEGRVRCFARELNARRSSSSSRELYLDASYCAALAGRAGIDEPSVCREVINEVLQTCHDDARRLAVELKTSTQSKMYQHVHLYPHISGIPDLLTT